MYKELFDTPVLLFLKINVSEIGGIFKEPVSL